MRMSALLHVSAGAPDFEPVYDGTLPTAGVELSPEADAAVVEALAQALAADVRADLAEARVGSGA
jgi:hypothetical protein